MSDHLKALARKGVVTVVEHDGGKTIVAIQSGGNVVTLEGGRKEQLLAELCQIVRNWPDTPEPRASK
jgi:hypothetical protein